MGCVSSKKMTPAERAKMQRDKQRSANIDKMSREKQAIESNFKKLLLLGAGESGKSTLFKQMITLYGKGYKEEDRKRFEKVVYSNTISAMKTLVEYSDELPGMDNVTLGTKVTGGNLESKRYLQDLPSEIDIDEEVAMHISALWQDQGIQNAFHYRAMFQLADSAQYFFDRLDAIQSDDYIPNQQDVLRSRVRTTGIVETAFEIEGNSFKMFDVGGQRNERKKWIHCFEDVTAVIFVAAISEYDQVLFEDETTNRMVEALNLFEEICNSRWFTNKSMVLFLNKRDLFEKKINAVKLTECFPDFDGDCQSFKETSQYIQEQFESKNRTSSEIYAHVTCATDTTNVAFVFNAVQDIVIKDSLEAAGLMQ